jgi:hypothetical protein
MCSAPCTRLRSEVARRRRRSPRYARAWQGITPSGRLRQAQAAACHAPCDRTPAQKTKQSLCARSRTRWLKHTRRLPARGDPSACRIKSCFVPCAPTARAMITPKPPRRADAARGMCRPLAPFAPARGGRVGRAGNRLRGFTCSHGSRPSVERRRGERALKTSCYRSNCDRTRLPSYDCVKGP